MADVYSWRVIPQTVVQRERWPDQNTVQGKPLVLPGQEVRPDQPVLRARRVNDTENTSGNVRSTSRPLMSPFATANRDVRTQTPEETLPAGLHGRVIEITRRGGVVIESRVALLHGTLGYGGQVAGILSIWQGGNTTQGPLVIPPGAILVVPGPLPLALLHQAISSGVVAIIASSMTLRDFEGSFHVDLVEALTNDSLMQQKAPLISLLLTEGLGTTIMPARVLNLLSRYEGSIALLSGTTSFKRAIFPELLISLPIEEIEQQWQPVTPERTLLIGSQVRVIAGERAGVTGIIDYFFVGGQVFSSGIRTRAARLRLEDGSRYIVPLSLLERIG